jgi:hypothetical protein
MKGGKRCQSEIDKFVEQLQGEITEEEKPTFKRNPWKKVYRKLQTP